MNYDQLECKVKSWGPSSTTALSNKKRVLEVLAYAKKWGIDPEIITAPISNLNEIIVPANKAIDDGDRKRLVELFTMASCLTNINLQLYLRNHRQRVIVLNGRPDQYDVTLTKSQLDMISRRTKFNLEFLVLERK